MGNAGIQFLSDIQFSANGLLLGNEFINESPNRDGGLVKFSVTTEGIAVVEQGTFGSFDGLIVGNGGLALHPETGELWGVEANDQFPRIFRIDPITGAAASPTQLLFNGNGLRNGFDGMGILPGGRFYATRGGGGAPGVNPPPEVYRIDPATGEVRREDIDFTGIQGRVNGLAVFVEPSGGPPPPPPPAD